MGIKGTKGGPKTPGSGRKKGTPNKITLSLQEKLDAFDNGAGFDPILEAMNLYTLIHADNPLVAAKILTELMQYIYPKRKALEHSGEINNPFMNKTLEELEVILKEKLQRDE